MVFFQYTVYTVNEADQSVNVCLSSLEPVQEPITIHLTTMDLNATGEVSFATAHVMLSVIDSLTWFHCQLEEVKAVSYVYIQTYVLIVQPILLIGSPYHHCIH